MKFRGGKGDLEDRKVIAQGSVQIVPETLGGENARVHVVPQGGLEEGK